MDMSFAPEHSRGAASLFRGSLDEFATRRTRKRYWRDAQFLLANLRVLLGLRRAGVARLQAFQLACRG